MSVLAIFVILFIIVVGGSAIWPLLKWMFSNDSSK